MELKFLTVDQVAMILGLSEKTVRNYIANGDLTAYKFGDRWNVKEEDLQTFLQTKSNKKEKKHND